MLVTFLGTGAAAPSKQRNCTGILLQDNHASSAMLLDCGEGTVGTLQRLFGSEAQAVIDSLDCIWISHLHADHHCGLLPLLGFRKKDSPLIIASSSVKDSLVVAGCKARIIPNVSLNSVSGLSSVVSSVKWLTSI